MCLHRKDGFSLKTRRKEILTRSLLHVNEDLKFSDNDVFDDKDAFHNKF